jgi:uncharacterized membrane protein YedE/YeeE
MRRATEAQQRARCCIAGHDVMSIDWIAFTPWRSLVGGILIGLAAALLVLFNGRVAGISGIVGGLFHPRYPDTAWRMAFVAGLVVAPIAYLLLDQAPVIDIDAGYPLLVGAGLLVGVGTRYGAGCTSGHGVCGISRLSPRSIVATIVFIAVGMLTVFVMRHALG